MSLSLFLPDFSADSMLLFALYILVAVGLFMLAADIFKFPTFKSVSCMESLARMQDNSQNSLDAKLDKIADWLAARIHINEFKRIQLISDLSTARIEKTPERYVAGAIVMGVLVGLVAGIISLFFMPQLCWLVAILLGGFMYSSVSGEAGRKIAKHRDEVEYELPRLVFTIEKTLVHSRDVLSMLETFAVNAGPDIKQEIDICVADMRSGNYEAALTHMETRVGSAMMSDICRGLISIIRGDDTTVYWATVSSKFSDEQRQRLKRRALAMPAKVSKLSMVMLVLTITLYFLALGVQLMTVMDSGLFQ